MLDIGYENVYALDGGWREWEKGTPSHRVKAVAAGKAPPQKTL